MSVVNVKKTELKKNGYKDFQDWNKKSNHLYIGRNMNAYVPGTYGSIWKNPFLLKKFTLEDSLKKYEEHVRSTTLYDQLDELDGKVLGCWCKPLACHGDVLLKLIEEKKVKLIEEKKVKLIEEKN